MVITHNMKNKKLLLGIAWAWLICLSANAEVKLPAFFSDGMVMQHIFLCHNNNLPIN